MPGTDLTSPVSNPSYALAEDAHVFNGAARRTDLSLVTFLSPPDYPGSRRDAGHMTRGVRQTRAPPAPWRCIARVVGADIDHRRVLSFRRRPVASRRRRRCRHPVDAGSTQPPAAGSRSLRVHTSGSPRGVGEDCGDDRAENGITPRDSNGAVSRSVSRSPEDRWKP